MIRLPIVGHSRRLHPQRKASKAGAISCPTRPRASSMSPDEAAAVEITIYFEDREPCGPYGLVVVEPPAHAPLALQRGGKSRAHSARLLLFLGAALRTSRSVVQHTRLELGAGISRC